MLREAVEIIRALWEGGYVRHQGQHFAFDSAKVWDLPDDLPPIGIAVSGSDSVRLAGELADVLIATEPKSELCAGFDTAGGKGKPKYGQLAVSWDDDERTARRRALEQFRWFGGGWKLNAELPGTAAFASASQYVTEDDIVESIPCGPDLDRHLEGIARFKEAGFTHLALVQIGGDSQGGFIDWAAKELLAAARDV
jgi:G6PDH family F420-dependent oxidoreductase